MNPDVVVLALASAPRPAGLAALYALLSASPPRRVVVAYLVAGLTFSVAVGVLVVAIFHGAGIDYRGTEVYSVIECSEGWRRLGLPSVWGPGDASCLRATRAAARGRRPSEGFATRR